MNMSNEPDKQVFQQSVFITFYGDPLSQVTKICDVDETRIQDALLKGAVWLQKKDRNKPTCIRDFSIVKPGDTVYINYNQKVLDEVPLALSLVQDEGNYSVWNKPSGMRSQGSKWADHCAFTGVVEKLSQKPAHLVHRLDRAASGLMLVAHTRPAVQKLSALFAQREIVKQYELSVVGKFSPVLPHIFDASIEGKVAKTTVTAAQYNKDINETDIKVIIETGRKHQIRVHLSQAGHPVVGDRLYSEEKNHQRDLQLRACELAFVCPFTQQQREYKI